MAKVRRLPGSWPGDERRARQFLRETALEILKDRQLEWFLAVLDDGYSAAELADKAGIDDVAIVLDSLEESKQHIRRRLGGDEIE